MSLPGAPEAVEVYDTVATRNATTPRVGQVAVTISDGALCVYYGAYLGWCPPWNVGWGQVARTVDSTFESFFNDQSEHDIPGLATTFTAVAGRRYKVTLKAAFGTNDTLNIGQGYIRFSDVFLGRPGVATVEYRHRISMPTGLSFTQFVCESEATFEAGAHTIRVSDKSDQPAGMYVNTGDGGINIGGEPAVLTIDDVGPAGAPVIA